MKHANGISFGNAEFYKKKKHKIGPIEKNLHLPTKKNRPDSVFMLEKKKTVLEFLKDFLQN